MAESKDWYFAVGEAQQGPYTLADMRRMVSDATITPNTWVGRHGSSKWIQAGRSEALVSGTEAALPALSALEPEFERGSALGGLRALAIAGTVGIAVAIVVTVLVSRGPSASARTAEAIDSLEKIAMAAATYYATPRISADTHTRVPCQFPDSQAVTPTEATCCAALGGPDADEDGRCDGDPEAWQAPTWRTLGFNPGVGHSYAYAFDSQGTLAAATFTATAYGDLDCDGTTSTFVRVVAGDPEATLGSCETISDDTQLIEREAE